MSHFLIIFDRKRRSDPKVLRIDDPRKAQRHLFVFERKLRNDPDHGVVLLVAEREEDIRKTHGQYFKAADDPTHLVIS
jgi:hypothetical protein